MEDFESLDLSTLSSPNLDGTGITRCHSERPYLPTCFRHLEAESERYRILILVLCFYAPISDDGVEALAASSVKVEARDVLASWKILISLGVAPLLYGFYAFLATIVAIKANAPMKWTIVTPLVVMSALPFIGYAALKFGEAGMDVLKYVLSSLRKMFTNSYDFLDH